MKERAGGNGREEEAGLQRERGDEYDGTSLRIYIVLCFHKAMVFAVAEKRNVRLADGRW